MSASYDLLESEIEDVADRVRIRYRLRGVDPDDGPVVVERTAYATVEEGRIAAFDVVCSGFRPI